MTDPAAATLAAVNVFRTAQGRPPLQAHPVLTLTAGSWPSNG